MKRILLICVAVALGACQSPTQIELQVSTDVPFAEGRTVAFTLGPPGQTDALAPNVVTDLTWGADGKLGTLIVTPSGDADEPVEVKVALGVGRNPENCSVGESDNCIVTRRQLSFVPNRTLHLPIGLFALCEGVPCGADTTCNALGACVANVVDAQGCVSQGGGACVVEGDDVLLESSLTPDNAGGAAGTGGAGGAAGMGGEGGGAGAAVAGPLCPGAAQDQIIVQDDFEANTEGSAPAGWELIYDGEAPEEQYTTSALAACGSQSLRLVGKQDWRALAMLPFTSSEPVISYEFSVMIEQQGDSVNETPGFFDPDAGQWGTPIAEVRFDHPTLGITFAGRLVGNWAPGTWYRARVVVDRSVGLGVASMWLDGVLQVQDAQLTQDAANIQGFAAVADFSGVPVHYDDVRIGVPSDAMGPFCPAPAVEQVLVQDDFEGATEGAPPADWTVIYDGAATNGISVTSDMAACGQSLRLLGESNWAALVMLPFTSSELVISYEFSIMIEQQGNDIPDRPGFFDPDASQWGTTFAPVRFDHSAREISFEGQVVGTWTAGTWYRVRVVVDRSVGDGTASMWLDGTLQVQDAQLGTAGIADVKGFSAVADHSSVPVYYDDVRVGVVP